jgi:hypothetical protein
MRQLDPNKSPNGVWKTRGVMGKVRCVVALSVGAVQRLGGMMEVCDVDHPRDGRVHC